MKQDSFPKRFPNNLPILLFEPKIHNIFICIIISYLINIGQFAEAMSYFPIVINM